MSVMTWTLPDDRDIEFEIDVRGPASQPYAVIGEIRALSEEGDWVTLSGADENKARSFLMIDERAQDAIDDRMWEIVREEWSLSGGSRKWGIGSSPFRSEYS